MKWGALLGITVIVACMVLYDWPKMNPKQKKEKAAFLGLTAMAWMFGLLLVLFPNLPSPSGLLSNLFKPLGRLLEK